MPQLYRAGAGFPSNLTSSLRSLLEMCNAGGKSSQGILLDEAKRAFDAMMGMKKIDVAAIKAGRRGRCSQKELPG
jgi:hypothetical protein